ncbi:MAG: hypothetical protein ABJF50_10440 [Paracoccaceae bacterium]
MKALHLITAAALALVTAPATAQIVPVAQVGPYRIMQVEDNNVCFAAIELLSAGQKPMIYSYYQTSQGQRWSVAGFASEMEIEDGNRIITVSIDGTETLSRETETRGGDFLLPFEALAEIEAHEALVETGLTMTIAVGDFDSVDVGLNDLRLALDATDKCLAEL